MVFQGMEGFDLEAARRHYGIVDTPKDQAASLSGAASGLTDASGRTLLHHAAASGDFHACRGLLSSGVDPRWSDHDGRTAADHARSAGHHELASALEGRVETEVEIAARAPLTTRELMGLVRDDAKMVQEIIAHNRLAARDAKGDTPLHIAAMRGKLQLVDLLVRAGADIWAVNAAGRTPAEGATANGFALLAGLLTGMQRSHDLELPETTAIAASVAETPHPSQDRLPFPSAGSDAMEVDFGQFDALGFEGVTEAADYHMQAEREEARASFQRVTGDIRVQSGFAEAQGEWEIGPISGAVAGEGIGFRTEVEGIEQQPALVGRRGLRRPARPSPWRWFSIDAEGCRLVVGQIVDAGYLSEDDIDELLGLCCGRFDPSDLSSNLEREFEAAGFLRAEDPTDQFWDARTEIGADELSDAVVAACTRALELPGTSGQVPDQKTLLRLTAALVDARRAALLGLAENLRAIDIILYMADRIAEGEVAAEAVSALVFDPAHPSSDGHLFTGAVEVLQQRRMEIAAGSGRAIREAADALELLELRSEFLRDVAMVMAESAALAEIAARLDRNLDTLEAGSDAMLTAFIPLCRRYAAQNETEEEDQEDLFQVGFFGLRRAVLRFRPELGTQFTAYASAWLRQSVARWRADESRLIRLPVHRQVLLAECRKAADTIEAQVLRDATPEEIAAELRMGLESAAKLTRMPQVAVELDQLDDNANEPPHGGIPEAMMTADIIALVHEELGQLHSRQADVICRRFGIGFEDEMTLEEVGQIYGVTRERIRQIEAKGMRILRHPARMRYLAKAL